MTNKALARESAIFQMATAIAFLAITMPLGLLYDVHHAASEESLSYADIKFAWPIYVSALIGVIWALIAAGTWIVALEEPAKAPGRAQE